VTPPVTSTPSGKLEFPAKPEVQGGCHSRANKAFQSHLFLVGIKEEHLCLVIRDQKGARDRYWRAAMWDHQGITKGETDPGEVLYWPGIAKRKVTILY